jgi:hypothetical protein
MGLGLMGGVGSANFIERRCPKPQKTGGGRAKVLYVMCHIDSVHHTPVS